MAMRCFVGCLLLLGLAASARAQFKDGEPDGPKLGKTNVSRWRCGIVVTASGGPCKGIVGYAPVPIEWPEQQVKVVEEDVSPEVTFSYQMVEGTAKVMMIKIAQLEANKQAKALVTFEISRSMILAPEKTDEYRIPDEAKLDRSLRIYLVPSPKIESRDAKIRALARQIGADKPKAWDHVEAIYDWVREHIKYKEGKLKGALAALKDGDGDCEEITSLFIAICRAADIPARSVWVPGHCYPEFYLEDGKGKGHWFPCQSAGARSFGCIPELRPILQKGDNFRPLFKTREHQRYLAEHLTGKPSPGGGKPQVRFVREAVN